MFVVLTACSSVKTLDQKTSPLQGAANNKFESYKDGQSLEEYLIKQIQSIEVGDSARLSHLADSFYLKGSDASLRGDSSSAAKFFEYVLKIKINDPYVLKRFAVELIRLNKLVDSKDILAKLYQLEKSENVGLILAGVHTALKEKREAQFIYLSLLKKFPKSEESCVFLAKSYSLESKFSKAYALLSKCAKRSKGKAIFSFYRGKIEIARDRRVQAVKYFKKSLKINSKYLQAAVALGSIYEEEKSFTKALSVYEKYLKQTPNSYSILKSVIQIYFALGKYEKVIPFAERLSNIDASDLNLKVRLGILYADSKRFDEAKGVFKEILTAVPNSDKVLYYLGSLHQQTGEFDTAVNYFSKVPEQSSLFHESHLQIAQMLQVSAESFKKGSREKFISFVNTKASKHADLSVELRVLLAGFYENENRVVEAISELDKIKSNSNFNEGHEYYLAALLEKNSQFEKSRVVIENLLKKNPENPHALNFLGYSLLERGIELDKAFALIKRAVEIKPDDGYIRDSLGWYYYKTGNLEMALVEIKKAWSLVKTDVVITKHLAMVYKELKRYSQAKKYYTEALKNCKVESERQDVINELGGLEKLRLPASE